MPILDIKVPSVGESVKEGMIHSWKVADGGNINRDQVLLELETDKATVEIFAEASGKVSILKKVGDTVTVGEVIARIDSDSVGTTAAPAAAPTAPASASTNKPASQSTDSASQTLSPAARRVAEEQKIDVSKVSGSGKDGRIMKEDLTQTSKPSAPQPQKASPVLSIAPKGARTERREPMSMLRRRIAERLIHAQSTAAILTTFNEIDMTALMQLRTQYKDAFKEKYGVSLGFMGVFVKAAIEALKMYPAINGWIEGNEIVYHDYYDIGVAVSSDKGLVVPVVKNAENLSLAELEGSIGAYAKKARDGKISIDDLTGGTFTVSNGGVFGSLMSTPILNPPQSGILGMHKIQERPIVVNGQIVARPMMYVALSYDHRIVDGKEAVQFLVKIKEFVEDPARILLGV